VKHLALNDPTMRDGLLGRFASHGVPQERIICMGASERTEHLRAFAEIDIALDPFPQNGGISTWEALYMGVPVIAKLGRGASSRAAGAILKAIGLDDWVAEDDAGYIEIAKAFATNPAYLGTLRAELRDMIAHSPAGNVAVYTRAVETGYRRFWQKYCASMSGAA
jgi:predicted O-linked N-acetylglucosamine transferase (SPINDLY family)